MATVLVEFVPLSMPDDERAVVLDQIGTLFADLQESGYDVTAGHDWDPSGDRFTFTIEGVGPD